MTEVPIPFTFIQVSIRIIGKWLTYTTLSCKLILLLARILRRIAGNYVMGILDR